MAQRIELVQRLGEKDNDATMRALIRLAQQQDLPEALATSIGTSLGRLCFRRQQDVDDLEMADFSGPAYIGYDTEIAESLRQHPEATMSRMD
jgi:hypothetical protein